MRVKLDDDNYPLVWGENIDGREIPIPPDPAHHHRWDETAGDWVRDDRPGKRTKQEIREQIQNNQISVRDAVMQILQ